MTSFPPPLPFQHGRDTKGSHGKPSPHKINEYEKYSDYSEDKYDYDEEEEDYEEDMSEYGQSKDSSFQGQGRGRRGKEHMKRGNMRTMKQQQCMSEPQSVLSQREFRSFIKVQKYTCESDKS